MAAKLDKLVQHLIPPSLVLLLVVTIIELFYGIDGIKLFVDIFDIYVIAIFAIDLYYRWQELPLLWPYVKKHYLDIIATIPFSLIFYGIEGLTLIRALRGFRIITRMSKLARYARLLRLLRFGARAPRFIRMRKHVKQAQIKKVQPHEKQMKGVLSFRVILLITINSIMGTGIWFLTSAGAKHAGPASLISWSVLSLISIYIAMCFGELTSMFPKAGGVYEFAKQSYGRFWSFIIGWTTSIAGSVTIAMLLLGALQYLIPSQYSQWYVPIAIGLIIVFNAVAYRGMQTSTVMLVTFALVTLVTVTAIIIPGFFRFQTGNFMPFFVFPAMNILLSIFFIAETFFGWESAIFLSAETKNPTKIMPKALVYGTFVIAGLAFLLALTAMGVMPWERFAQSAAPLRDLGAIHFGAAGGIIFTLLVFTSIIGAVASWIVTAPRLLMSIAEDKLFFVQFAKIHPKHKSPYVSIIFQAIVISILVYIGAGSYETLLHMLIPLILVVYSTVLLSVVILRFKKPFLPRPYKVVAGKVGPLLTIIFMLFLLFMFIRETHGALDILRISASLIAFGTPAYFAIELFYDDQYVKLRKNWAAKLSHFYHSIPLPNKTYSQIVSYIKPLHNATILTYNFPMGAFTERVITKALKFKHIYAANESKEQIEEFRKKIQSKNVTIIPLRTLSFPKTEKLDVFVSYNALGHVKDIPKFLKSLSKALKKEGRFCFYISHHILNVTPNALTVEDKAKMQKLFKDAGLKATYNKKRTLSGENIFIYGRS